MSLPMRAVLLVPRRKDNGHRDSLWAWCRARSERYMPDLAIYEGFHTDGLFNRSAAINTAARLADADGRWDIGIVIDADIFLRVSQARAAIRGAAAGRVTWGHRRWRGIAEKHTAMVIGPRRPHDFGPEIDRDDMDVFVGETTPRSWSCFIAIPRAIWDDMGGFDERFVGWGYEDMAVKSLVTGLYPWGLVEGDVYHLWHPRSEERIVKGQPASTATADYNRNARLGRRYMVAAYRDHGAGDEPGAILSDELRAKHVENLMNDDAMIAARQPGDEQRRWTAMGWPTLEQLRDGAKVGTMTRAPTVTLVVHTDGRREYIAQSIPSLMANVSGPIVKRVIFDDSGDPDYKAWLAEQFPAFYVVGPDKRLGQAGSMAAMWSYLDRKCSTDYVFGTEDDFLYDRRVDLVPMIETLEENPHLRQVALLRAPYYPRELEAGSIIAEHPEAYELQNGRPHPFLEHRLWFTFNPSLFSRALCRLPMPTTKAETGFTDLLNRDPASRFGLWGSGEPWTTHIGAERVGTGY